MAKVIQVHRICQLGSMRYTSQVVGHNHSLTSVFDGGSCRDRRPAVPGKLRFKLTAAIEVPMATTTPTARTKADPEARGCSYPSLAKSMPDSVNWRCLESSHFTMLPKWSTALGSLRFFSLLWKQEGGGSTGPGLQAAGPAGVPNDFLRETIDFSTPGTKTAIVFQTLRPHVPPTSHATISDSNKTSSLVQV